MTASKKNRQKSSKRAYVKMGVSTPQWDTNLKIFTNYLQILRQNLEVSMIQNSKYLDKFFITFIIMNYTKKVSKIVVQLIVNS